MDLLLGTLGRHAPILATIPTRFDSACTLPFLPPPLCLGLRCSRRSTRTRQMTDFSTFSARLFGVKAVCWSVTSVPTSWTCLLRLIVTFAPTFRSLSALAWCSFAHGSKVFRSWLCLSRGVCSRDRDNFAPEICPFFKVSTRTSKWVFSCDSGNLSRNVPILISSVQDLATVPFLGGCLAFPSRDSFGRVALK